jgi:hypothetical protein
MRDFVKRIALGLLLALPWIGTASAQQNNMYCWVDNGPPIHWVPCQQGVPLSTVNIGPDSQASLSFANGQPLSLLAYDFGSGTLNTSTQFNRPITGGGGNATAATNVVGQTTLGTGTSPNGWSVLISQRTIWDRNPGYNYYQDNINIPIPTVTHAYMLFGFVGFPFTAGVPSPTLATPAQNAAAFEFGVGGKLSAVTFASGTRQLVADLSVAQGNTPASTQASTGVAGTYSGGCNCTPQIQVPKGGAGTLTDSYKYVIVFRGDNILWYIEQPNGNLGLVAYTTRGAVGLDVNQVTVGHLALADATGPSSTATMQINQITVGDTAKNAEPGFDRSVYPQQALTAVNDAVGVSAMGAASCSFTTVSNTNVTLVFEASDPNGTTWTAVTGYPWSGGAGIQTVPSGTNGSWTIPCAGMNQVRMRVSAIGATPTVLATAEASVGTTVQGVISPAVPGTPNITQVLSVQGETGMTPVISTADPCGSVNKSSVAISITSATTTSLVALSGTTTIYVCGFAVTIAPSATTADTFLIESGTGAACVTTQAALTGTFGNGEVPAANTTAPVQVSYGNGNATVFKTPASGVLCGVTAGTAVNVQGVLTYVQQ